MFVYIAFAMFFLALVLLFIIGYRSARKPQTRGMNRPQELKALFAIPDREWNETMDLQEKGMEDLLLEIVSHTRSLAECKDEIECTMIQAERNMAIFKMQSLFFASREWAWLDGNPYREAPEWEAFLRDVEYDVANRQKHKPH